MALSRQNEFNAGTVLTEAKLEGEFDQLYSNALSLISPLTGNLDVNSKQLVNAKLENIAGSKVAANEGIFYFNITLDQLEVDDGVNIRRVPSIASLTRGMLAVGGATANQWVGLPLGAAGTTLGSNGTDLIFSAGTLPPSGTDGGILGYTSPTTLVSSALLTQRALVIGGGAGATPTTIAALTNGQLAIGSTGANPVPAALTAGNGMIVTPGAGSITLALDYATQTEMETATSLVDVVTPGRVHNHPGVAKGWGAFNLAGTLDSGDYNIASVTDNGTGDWTVNWSTDFSNAFHVNQVTFEGGVTFRSIDYCVSARTAGTTRILTYDTASGAAVETGITKVMVTAWGDQ